MCQRLARQPGWHSIHTSPKRNCQDQFAENYQYSWAINDERPDTSVIGKDGGTLTLITGRAHGATGFKSSAPLTSFPELEATPETGSEEEQDLAEPTPLQMLKTTLGWKTLYRNQSNSTKAKSWML